MTPLGGISLKEQIHIALDPVSSLIRDPDVTDIFIYGRNKVFVKRFGRGLSPESCGWPEDIDLQVACSTIAQLLKKKLNVDFPLLDGRLDDGSRINIVIGRIVAGEEIGTIFMPKRKLSNRSRWILNSAASGTIFIDDGAMKAVKKRKSLLPSGVTSVKGAFEAGDVVMLNESAKAVTSIASIQLKTLAGKHSTEIKKLLGPAHRDVVAIPEDIVIIDY